MAPASKTWSVEDLIRWRVRDLRDRNLEFGITPESVAEMLSCANLSRDDTPRGADKALTQLRHLRQDTRVNKVRAVLGEGRLAKLNERARVANAVDALYEKQRETTAAIEALIEGKVQEALRVNEQDLRELAQEFRKLGQEVRALRQEWNALRSGGHGP